MLVRVLFQNFLSYYEGVEFNMLPNPKRTRFKEHIYNTSNPAVLKVSAIYGANGAGKSNILKGFEILRSLVLDKSYMSTEDVYNNYRFLLADDTSNKPISIGVEFSNNGKTFYYRIDIQDNLITLEELYIFNTEINKEVPIYISKYENGQQNLKVYDSHGIENTEYVDTKTTSLLSKNPTSSILALQNEFPIILNDDVNIAFNWFHKKLVILPLTTDTRKLIERFDRYNELLQYINKQISSMSIGIKSIDIKTYSLADVFANKVEKNEAMRSEILKELQGDKYNTFLKLKRNRPLFSVTKDNNGQDIVKELVFTQQGVSGYECDMNIDSQSEGTLSLISKLPFLFRLSKRDVVVLVDELESSLHPQLIERFLKLFLDDNNSKGQLVFTTHEVHLLDQHNLLRADEVWFAEKHQGQTKLYSLNDFKEHNTINIAKGYLAGRYGAIPFFGESNLLSEQ
ncbi:MAG: ATP-binding protein [Rikenellaceae bacterium]